MRINFNAVSLLAIAMPLVAAAPSEGNVDASLAKRQRQYQCETSNDLGACNSAITKLRGHEARGCDVWYPVADLACLGAVANFQGPCKDCEPF
ncbi:hypothetical protein COL154_011282 [Colletotrichum chrysophilum]|uniref:uncharacterized protein n=1 Tax=Colletotrichum chrysophilum TaxID=1836956 RepID=UPI002300C99B|nr:uncharacterized protein COL26b_011586 [Colletotrichum chrysophilum]KAJ0343448.1 hypothetical protein KNSL1_010307 [Colletotrichum chrysophilum]KAJ0355740.1 hypothetical protein COL154_011282 [Colletotrichum chrysophilum]KAJ0366651.1 hypothetical protein COL26b_011586 [Colletotrichum chrysophilum]